MSRTNLSRACISPEMQAVGATNASSVTAECEAFIANLPSLGLEELRAEWLRRLGRQPPGIRSKDVFRGLLAWAVQARLYGDLSSQTRQQLRIHARSVSRTGAVAAQTRPGLMPGTVLTREWQGKTYRVVVQEKGYDFEGKTLADLSSIAREITGTRWSGPRFFGLAPKTPQKAKA